VLVGFAIGFGAQAFFQLWSGEIFPTRLRSTAQGMIFAVVRISLGFWSYFVPTISATDYKNLALILIGFLTISGLTGVLFGPRTSGKTLEAIEREYGWTDAALPEPAALVAIESTG